jgi:hypothetical protein
VLGLGWGVGGVVVEGASGFSDTLYVKLNVEDIKARAGKLLNGNEGYTALSSKSSSSKQILQQRSSVWIHSFFVLMILFSSFCYIFLRFLLMSQL